MTITRPIPEPPLPLWEDEFYDTKLEAELRASIDQARKAHLPRDLRRKWEPDIPRSLKDHLGPRAEYEVYEVLSKIEIETLEWVLREIFEVTP